MPAYSPSSPPGSTDAPGRQGATRSTSSSTAHACSSGAGTVNSVSRFMWRQNLLGHHEIGTRREQRDARELGGGDRRAIDAEPAEVIDQHRGAELAGDGGR